MWENVQGNTAYKAFQMGKKESVCWKYWKYFPITSSISHSPVKDIASEIYFSLLAPFLFHFHLKDKQTEACLVLKQSRGEKQKGRGWEGMGCCRLTGQCCFLLLEEMPRWHWQDWPFPMCMFHCLLLPKKGQKNRKNAASSSNLPDPV